MIAPVASVANVVAMGKINQYKSWGGGYLAYFLHSTIFRKFSALSKHLIAIEYDINIWQMSLPLSCSGTCHI